MTVPKRVPDLAQAMQHLPRLRKIFDIRTTSASCIGSVQLEHRYGAPIDNTQLITSVRNRVTHELCLFNGLRASKPQQFVGSPPAAGESKPRCDFCAPSYDTMTATDVGFGRIEGRHVVTASNLFKYCGPYQAVVFSKSKHDVLDFTLDELCDYLSVSAKWFRACVSEHDAAANSGSSSASSSSLNPMLIWNAGERSGASQKHQHMQLLLSASAFPQHAVLEQLTAAYEGDYHRDLVEAHREVGLAHTSPSGNTIFVSLLPTKNREMVVIGENGIEDPEFQRLVFVGLRTMIDECGTNSFNLGVLPGAHGTEDIISGRVVARLASRGQTGQTSIASDYGGLEVFGGASIGHDDPFIVKECLDRQLAIDASG